MQCVNTSFFFLVIILSIIAGPLMMYIARSLSSLGKFVKSSMYTGLFFFCSLLLVKMLFAIDFTGGEDFYPPILGLSIAVAALALVAESTYDREYVKEKNENKELSDTDVGLSNVNTCSKDESIKYRRYHKYLPYTKILTYFSIRLSYFLAVLSAIGLFFSSGVEVNFSFNGDVEVYEDIIAWVKTIYEMAVVSICMSCLILAEKVSTICINVDDVNKK